MDQQWANAASSICTTDSGMVTLIKFSQLYTPNSFIFVTLPGIYIFNKLSLY